MSNIERKVKQSSLTEFYKKVDHEALMPYYYQLAPISSPIQQYQQQTLINYLYQSNTNNLNDKSNFSSQLVASYVPQTQQYQPILGQQQQQLQSIYLTRDIHQNLFKDYYEEKSQLLEGVENRKRKLQESEVDYNLSIQPQEITHRDYSLKAAPTINRFRLQTQTDQQSKLVDNFIITPENSLLKSPSNIKLYQYYHQIDTAPQISKQQNDDKQGACSTVIEKLQFGYEKCLQSELRNQGQLGCESNKRKDYQHRKQQETSNGPVKQFWSQQQPNKQENKPFSFNNSPQQPQQQPSSNKKSQILSSDQDQDQDSSQLLNQIRLLQSQVSQLKTHKYHHAINQYREQTRLQLQKKLQQSISQINSKYQQQQSALKKQYEMEINIYNKSVEDISKYKKTYAIILGQLRENREKIESQYSQKVQQVNRFKQRLIVEWKRNSNEEIKKIINNVHPKHSIKLTNSIEKPTNTKLTENQQSKGKISPFIKQKSQETLLENKSK